MPIKRKNSLLKKRTEDLENRRAKSLMAKLFRAANKAAARRGVQKPLKKFDGKKNS